MMKTNNRREKCMMSKKQVKSYTLSKEAIEAVVAYSGYSGNSLSQSVEYLTLRGLENTQIAEQLTDRVTQHINRFIDSDRKNTDRLIGVLIGQTRILGKIFGTSITAHVRSGLIKQDELETIYGSGIKQCMVDLKSNSGKDHD
jgi:hypothetical protein